ncbi:MAG: DUF4199 domain-containing protein [Salibacteraceae bacterium]
MRHPFIYGTLTALFLLSWEIYLTETGAYDLEPQPVGTVLQIIYYALFLGLLGIGLWKMKQEHQNQLPLKEGFLTGLNMSVMAALVSALAFWFYLSDFNPEYLETLAQANNEAAKEQGQELNVTPGQVALTRSIWQFLSVTFTGLLLSLPVAFILRSSETK